MTRARPRRPGPGFLLLAAVPAVSLSLLAHGAGAAHGADTASTGSPAPSTAGSVESYLTTPDQAHLLERQAALALTTTPSTGAEATVQIDPAQRYQSIDGFGASLTDSAATVLAGLDDGQRSAVMSKLFEPTEGAGLTFLRQPLGASDFTSSGDYTYDDVPAGSTDPGLAGFSTAHDDATILPRLEEAERLSGNTLTVMGSPWSPPAWMRTGDSVRGSGGSLEPQHDDAYARYFAEFVRSYAAAGVPVQAVTLQNEPENAAAYPSMTMTAAEQIAFAPHLRAAFDAAGLTTRIVAYDHNWDDTTYPDAVLAGAGGAVDGTAFHCYAGDVSAQSVVHDAHPEKDVYFTECSGSTASPTFADNLSWNVDTLMIGATRNWARTVGLWNLALDERGGPTNGGCGTCRGVVTVDSTSGAVTYNAEYYALGEIAKVVRPGATRIASPATVNGVGSVAFQNTDGSYALLLHDDGGATTVRVSDGTRSFSVEMAAGAVQSFRWPSRPTPTTGTVPAPPTPSATSTPPPTATPTAIPTASATSTAPPTPTGTPAATATGPAPLPAPATTAADPAPTSSGPSVGTWLRTLVQRWGHTA